MSKRFALTAFLLFLAASGALFAENIAWRSDLATAVAEAKKTGKLLMVDVYTDWCGWCKKLDSDTYTDAKVIKLSTGYVPLKINPETSKEGNTFVQKYGVSGYPTILFVEADGTLANKIVGYLDAPGFADMMTKTSEYTPKVKSYLAEFKAGKYANSQQLLSMLVELGRVEEARTVFDTLRASTSMDKGLQESTAYAIADAFYNNDDYDDMFVYLKIVEDINSGTDTTRQAYLMHSVGLYYAKGKSAGIDFLEALLKNPKIPASWAGDITSLRDKMKAAN